MQRIIEETETEKAAEPEKEEPPLELNLQDIKKTREMELKEQIKDFVDENPEISAQLIRTWLKGEDGF